MQYEAKKGIRDALKLFEEYLRVYRKDVESRESSRSEYTPSSVNEWEDRYLHVIADETLSGLKEFVDVKAGMRTYRLLYSKLKEVYLNGRGKAEWIRRMECPKRFKTACPVCVLETILPCGFYCGGLSEHLTVLVWNYRGK